MGVLQRETGPGMAGEEATPQQAPASAGGPIDSMEAKMDADSEQPAGPWRTGLKTRLEVGWPPNQQRVR